MPRLTIVQTEPVSSCIPMMEGGLATAQMGRKQDSNTEICAVQKRVFLHRH